MTEDTKAIIKALAIMAGPLTSAYKRKEIMRLLVEDTPTLTITKYNPGNEKE